MFSTSPAVRAKLNVEMKKITLLENHAIVQREFLETSSSNTEPLSAIEVRQYRERGLLHISDKTYEFFLALEQKRVDRINLERKFANIFEPNNDADKVGM